MKRSGAPFHVARRVSTDPAELHRLRHHGNRGVRLGVASNPSTRRDTFLELLAHCDASGHSIRSMLGSPLSGTIDVSDGRGLDEHQHSTLREAAARRPDFTLVL